MISFQDYLDFIQNSRTRFTLVKFEILRQQDETPLKEITSKLRLDGSLNIKNTNGIRASLGVTLDNALNEFFPSLDSGIWVGQKARLSLGYVINGEEFYLKQGTFVHSKPTVNPDKSVRLNMVDKFSLLDGSASGILDTILIIPALATLGNTIRTIMTISQDVQDVLIDTNIDSIVIPYPTIKEEGSTLGEILIELADAFSCNVFYNENGNLVFEKDTPDSTKGSIHDFDADSDDETNYQEGNTEYNFDEVVNSVTVIGDNVNGLTFRANVQNNDLLSDTSVENLNLEILKTVKDNIIYSIPLCIERAKYVLKRLTNVLTQSRISSLPIPHLTVDKVVTVKDSRLDFIKKRVLIDAISIPFNNSSSMSLTVMDTFDIDL